MTVASTYTPPQYAGNGVTTAFSFPYAFFATSDLVVTLFDTTANAVITPAPLLGGAGTYDYTVTATADINTAESPNGTITFNTAPPTNFRVTIQRAVPATQSVSLTNTGPFPAKTIEAEFDRLTMLTQQAQATLARAILGNPSDPSTVSLTLPPAASRAGLLQGFDGAGNVTTFPSSSLYSTGAGSIVIYNNTGVDPTGLTDSTAGIQAQINLASALGAVVDIRPGKYLIAGQLSLGNVYLRGPGIFRRDVTDYTTCGGAIFLITNTSSSPLLIANNGGVVIDGLNFFWPNQTVATTPIAYPALITSAAGFQFDDLTVTNCAVINAYDFLTVPATATGAGDIRINRSKIYAIHNVFNILATMPETLFVHQCTVEFGVYDMVAVFANGGYLANWTAANGTFLLVDPGAGNHLDGLNLTATLIFGYHNGIVVNSGYIYAPNVSDCYFDGVPCPLTINANGQMLGGLFDGCLFYCYQYGSLGLTALNAIQINTNNQSDVTFTGCNYVYTEGSWFTITGTAGHLLAIEGGYMQPWCRGTALVAYACYVNGGSISVVFKPSLCAGNSAKCYGVLVAGEATVRVGTTFVTCQVPVTVAATALGKVLLEGNISIGTFGGASVANTAGAAVVTDFGNIWDKPLLPPSYASDAAASGAGIPVGGYYRNGSALQMRVV